MLLLDTHVLVWLVEGKEMLSPRGKELIAQAQRQGAVAVSVISFWEVARLAARERLRLNFGIVQWRFNVLSSGIQEIPLSGPAAIAATCLDEFHADPADRFIVATAMQQNATLLTADREILSWHGALQREDARQ